MKALFTKQHLYLVLTILIVSTPNIILIFIGEDSVVASFLKKIVFFEFSLAFILFPLVIIRPKYYALFVLLISPFIITEIIHVFQYKVPIMEGSIMMFIFSDKLEIKEYLMSNLNYIYLFILLFILQFILVLKLKKNFKLTKKSKSYLLLICVISFLIMFVRDYKVASKSDVHAEFKQKLKTATYYYNVKLDKIFPLDIFRKLIKFNRNNKISNNYSKNIENFKFNALKKDSINNVEIYVLVIGETARKQNFGLYNYTRTTTPKLINIENLNIFNNVKSAANVTSISLPILLSRATPTNYGISITEPPILNAYKEAGFKTYWLSNQSTGISNIFGFYTLLADEYINVAKSLDASTLDEDLFPILDKVLNSKESKKFIIIHTIGSHFRYNFRYPKSYEKFTPVVPKGLSVGSNNNTLKNEFINSYDNTILYTDFILSEIINKVKQKNAVSYVYYISDHGENLFDTKENYFLHGFTNPTKYEMDIPLFVWNSDKYIETYPEKINLLKKHKFSRISTTNSFHTLLDLANITYKEEKLNQSFANEKFDTIQPRLLLNPNKKVIKID